MTKKIAIFLGIFIFFIMINYSAAADMNINAPISKSTSSPTKILDKNPPKIVNIVPAKDETTVPLTTTICLKFNEKIKNGVNYSKIIVRNSNNDEVPAKKWIYSTYLLIKPTSLLKYSTKYTFYLPPGSIKDYAGNSLQTTYKSSFTTENRPLSISKVKYWAYQLQNINTPGAVDMLVDSKYDMVVLEPTRTDWSSDDKYFNTKAMVKSLKNSLAYDGLHRKLVIAYLNIGEAENWQWYWKWSKNWATGQKRPIDWPSYILTQDPDGWEGDYPVAYWDPRWKNIIIHGKNLNSRPYGDYNSAMDEILKDGFDGVYLDWVEGYDDPSVIKEAKRQKRNPQTEMVKLIREIKTFARLKNPNFLLIQQHGAELVLKHRELLSHINAISQEAIWYDGYGPDTWNNPNGYDQPNDPYLTSYYLELLSIYKKAGKPVFDCEYAVNKAADAYTKSRARGFIPYCTRRSLSQLAPPSYPTVKAASASHPTVKAASASHPTVKAASTSYHATKLTTSSSAKYKLSPPSKGVYHSAFPDFGGSEDQVTAARIHSFQKITGKRITWACFSDNWGKSKIKFPAKAVKILKDHNIIPYIRLMPRTSLDEGIREKNYTLQRIISGVFDSQLILWARAAKSTKIPLMVDFACEMNGDWFPWSGVYNGGKTTNKYGDKTVADGPERYRDAYRHIINLFRKEGVKNVNWVFHVDAYSSPDASWNRMANYYPGDSYIDWIGVSAYGAQTPSEDWTSFTSIMNRAYPQLAKISKTKPLAVLEFGVTEYPHNSYKKATWIKNALQSLKKGKYPRIKAISYWHENWENEDGTKSLLRLDSSIICRDIYRREISSSYFVTRPLLK